MASIEGIQLSGHTDVRGDVAFDPDLSARRARAVADLLLQTCLNKVPISIREAGEQHPLNEGSTAVDHAQNRQVTVHLELDGNHPVGTAFLQRHPKVEPLMPEAETKQEIFQVDPSSPIEFVASDGVRVRIAAGAILDQHGKRVTAPVDISYRSFNDPWSIIASGIPMHVGDRENAGHMESLGMYEVYDSPHGTPLSLREGEGISLTRPTAEQRTAGYLDWILDESTGEWVERPTTTDSALQPATEQIGDERNPSARFRYVNAIRRLPMLPDSTVFRERLASSTYCHTEPCGSAAKPHVYEDGRYVSPYSDKANPAIEVITEKGVYRGQRVTGFRIKLRNDPSHTE